MIKLQKLNFAENYQFRLKQEDDSNYIFCNIRKKWLILTPEEWVRQNVIQFLIHELNYKPININSEIIVKINGLSKRADIIVFKNAKPFIVVECKAPQIQITQETFDQIARYNMQLEAEFLMVSNGLQHYYCQMDHQNQKYNFLQSLPFAH